VLQFKCPCQARKTQAFWRYSWCLNLSLEGLSPFCRLKFEQRGKEISENKKGIEEMVQHLKTQLDERDLTIQELQRGLQSTPSPARVTGLQEMKEHVRI
jgi:hypothetical protein